MSSHDVREQTARKAYEALGSSPSQHIVLMVQCNSAHHLGAVYKTEAGRVFRSVLHSKSHGRKDRADVPHHAGQLGRDWFDLLELEPDASVDDDLPAGCECGPSKLSRDQLRQEIAAGRTKLVLKLS